MRSVLDRDQERPTGDRAAPRLFRALASLSMLLAAASATVTAAIDAASVTGRISGRIVESRPLWLHTFSISLVTIAVAAGARWGRRLAVTVQARVVYALTAALNLTVPVLRQGHPDFRFVLPALHVVLAALLISLSLVARRNAQTRGR